ncbi:DUF222 domain-containing protein, partial [Aquipuribacter sp. SD81]|uniref:DUF222 domain-containing protein n=1 Tax=Aquipuribacter sp. SD81 TaxID=3127703 RepID=UPI0030192EB9
MFESGAAAEVLAAATALAGLGPAVDDAARVDRIRALEELKAAAAAAQARDAADLYRSRCEAEAAAGVPARERGRGVASEVALARRESPHRGGRHLGLARALVDEMPHTLAGLEAGRISEWRATLLVRETAVLARADREAVDEEVAAGLDELERLGDRALVARVRQVAYRLDPRSVVERARRAEGERCVTVRPAPDTMAYLTALLPVRQAVSVQVALQRSAETARCAGDERSRGQVMADALVGAVLGSAGATPVAAVAPVPSAPDVAVQLVMTDRALLGGDDEPARLDGIGTVPSAWARDVVARTLEEDGRVFVSRLLLDPLGAVVASESRARCAPPGLARLVRLRDGG